MRAAVLLAVVFLLPMVPASSYERLQEVVFGPLVIASFEAQPIADILVPEGFSSVFAQIESRRVSGVGVHALKLIVLMSPSGDEGLVLHHGGAGAYVCLPTDLPECEDTWADPVYRSRNMAATPGVWTLDFRGATTAEYTVAVYAER